MIFVDTGAWYASLVPADPDHARAVNWLAGNHSPLLTTDYVIDETLTLLRVRGERKRALLLGKKFFDHDLADIHKITATDLTLAWQTFEEFDDKNWGFTDCTSKVVMERLSITTAFAFDHHFRQFWNYPSRAVRQANDIRLPIDYGQKTYHRSSANSEAKKMRTWICGHTSKLLKKLQGKNTASRGTQAPSSGSILIKIR